MESISTIVDETLFMDINERLARRLSQLREEYGLSIEELADRSGVSRATISKIERAESSPTATVLNKLAIGLGVLLPSLFGPIGYAEPRLQQRDPVVSRKGQAEWRDPDTGYSRRTLTPSTAGQMMQLSEIRFPAGARVTFENAFGGATVQQQIWMLDGQMELRLGNDLAALRAGDCMAMTLDRPITFHNPGSKDARYLVAIAHKSR
jgi:transcriptional regulator with XRE-family HTH domain